MSVSVERLEQIIKHVADDDYLPTLATVLRCDAQSCTDPKVAASLHELSEELLEVDKRFQLDMRL